MSKIRWKVIISVFVLWALLVVFSCPVFAVSDYESISADDVINSAVWCKNNIAAGSYLDSDGDTLCLAFVADFWSGFGYTRSSAYSAYAYAQSHSLSQSSIPIGADVFFNTSQYWHIGVYIGDNLFVNVASDGSIQSSNITSAFWSSHYQGWCWHDYVSVVDRIIPPITPVDLGSDFYAYIEACNGAYIKDENSNVVAPVAPEFVAQPSYDPLCIWRFVRDSDGAYKIMNEYSGRCLDAADFGTADGTNVGMCTSNDGSAQRWYVINTDNEFGGYYILPKYATNLALDKSCDGSGYEDPGNIQLFTRNDTLAQRFSIYQFQSGVFDQSQIINYQKPAKPDVPSVSVNQTGTSVSVSWTSAPLQNAYFDSRTYNLFIYSGSSASGSPVKSCFGLNGLSMLVEDLAPGIYTAEVRAVNTKYENYQSASGTTTFTVIAGPVISTSILPNAVLYKEYSTQLSASGSGSINWSLMSGSLPSGIILDASTGTISGRPKETGTFTFTIKAIDSIGSSTAEFTLVVENNQEPVYLINEKVTHDDPTQMHLQYGIQNDTDDTLQGRIITIEYSPDGNEVSREYTEKSFPHGETIVEQDIILSESNNMVKVFFVDASTGEKLTKGLILNGAVWAPEENVPAGSTILDQKWTYTLTERKSSSESSMSGWTLIGSDWVQKGETSAYTYASYPEGFATDHALYSKYNKAPYAVTSGTTNGVEWKTDVISQNLCTYIYFHWTPNKYQLSNNNYNVSVEDHYLFENGREYYNFRAFESTSEYGHYDPNGAYDAEVFYAWFDNPEDGSWWWFHFPVYTQNYATFEKVYSFVRIQEGLESDTEVYPSDTISEVKHMIEYVADISIMDDSPVPAIGIESITLNRTELKLTEGFSETLIATILPSGAANRSVIWTSSDSSVATVVDGVVTAVGKGIADITATTVDGGLTAVCRVTVKEEPENKFELRGGENYILNSTDPVAGDFTIESELPCIAIYSNGEESMQLTPTLVAGNMYSFTLPDGFDGEGAIVISVKCDFNGDGEITSTDAMQVLRCAAGNREYDGMDILICDANGDGELTSTDALQILRASVGLRELSW